MAVNRYELGELVRVAGVFTTVSNGAAVDPGALSFKFIKPGGSVTTYVRGTDAQLVKDSTGNYHVDLSLDTPGVWHYRWLATGDGQAAQEGQFVVENTRCA